MNKNTQIKNKMIRSHPKTDREKLAGLERFIHKEYPDLTVLLEWYLLFVKGEDKFENLYAEITKEMTQTFTISNPDLVLVTTDEMVVVELDGGIHDVKTEKTNSRNKRYELNHIPYIVINEADLKFRLRKDILPESWNLSQDQINAEFKERFEKL